MLKAIVNSPVRSGDQTIINGDLVIGTSGEGVNFNANTPAAGMTSQLLNWYEEGAWTPTQGAGLTVVGAFTSSGTYTRIGRLVTVTGVLNGVTSVAAAAGGVLTTGLPFNAGAVGSGGAVNANANSGSVLTQVLGGGTIYSVSAITASTSITFSITYTV
jgi:hypothetical protein